MTKKDFQLIADILKDYNLSTECFEEKLQIQSIIGRFANVLGENNPLFDRNKFINACGPVMLIYG